MKIAEVPICLAGHLTPAFPSLCMDDATHLLDTPIIGSIRIKATNDAAANALEKYSESETSVTVCGYPRSSVNCQHIDAYYVAEAADAAPRLQAL